MTANPPDASDRIDKGWRLTKQLMRLSYFLVAIATVTVIITAILRR